SIVWASLGLMCGLLGVGGIVILMMFSKQMEAKMGPMPPSMKPVPAQIALMVIGMLWCILLLTAGITTVLRKGSGRTLHLVYAVGSILLTIPSLGLEAKKQMAMADWVAKNPDSEWAKRNSSTGAVVALSIGGAMGLAYPVFCLVWFLSKKHSPE